MTEQLYICRACRVEFPGPGGPGICACPKCGSLDTAKYDPSSILSILAAKLGSGGG